MLTPQEHLKLIFCQFYGSVLFVFMCVCVLSHARLFVTLWTVACQASLSWNSPGKNAGVGCHFLLQGIFPTQGSNQHSLSLLHWQAYSLPLCHLGSPLYPQHNAWAWGVEDSTCSMNIC